MSARSSRDSKLSLATKQAVVGEAPAIELAACDCGTTPEHVPDAKESQSTSKSEPKTRSPGFNSAEGQTFGQTLRPFGYSSTAHSHNRAGSLQNRPEYEICCPLNEMPHRRGQHAKNPTATYPVSFSQSSKSSGGNQSAPSLSTAASFDTALSSGSALSTEPYGHSCRRDPRCVIGISPHDEYAPLHCNHELQGFPDVHQVPVLPRDCPKDEGM